MQEIFFLISFASMIIMGNKADFLFSLGLASTGINSLCFVEHQVKSKLLYEFLEPFFLFDFTDKHLNRIVQEL